MFLCIGKCLLNQTKFLLLFSFVLCLLVLINTMYLYYTVDMIRVAKMYVQYEKVKENKKPYINFENHLE